MELRYLKTFHTIATLGSFYRAAEVLGYAQSTVSDQIKALETDLKVTLFKRAGNQLNLTPAGERLFQYAPKVLNMENELRLEVGQASTVSGTISMRVPETVGLFLLPVVQEFHRTYPRVNFGFNTCTFFGLEEELHTGMIDLAFLLADEYKSPGVEAEPLMEIPLVAVTSPGHRLARMAHLDLAELRNELFLIPTSDCGYIQMLEKILTAEKMDLPQIWRLNTLGAIKQVLISGSGVSVLPRVAVRAELDEGRLAVLNWRPLEAKLLMIWQKSAWHPTLIETFVNSVRNVFHSGQSI